MEMTNAYSVIANGGFQVAPWFIERVTRNDDHQLIDEATPQVACPSCAEGQKTVEIDGREYPVAKRVANAAAFYILRDMLRNVITSGTGRGALEP